MNPNDRELPNYFAGPYLDRRAETRSHADWIRDARADAATLWILARGTSHLVHVEPQPRIAFVRGDHPLVTHAIPKDAILLGWFGGARCVLVEAGNEAADVPAPAGARFEELRPLATQLPADQAGLLAYARALSIWRLRHRFCGACGAVTHPVEAGHLLRCTNPECGGEIFPRIDPAIIVLVTDGERALLGRQASWPRGRYSTIAGFVEPGESLEDAVARETHEETGVAVRRIEYHSSQPWPFPSSLMLGFTAYAAPGAAVSVGAELEDARWFTRDEIAAGTALLPTRTSISYRLIEHWFDAGAAAPLAAIVEAQSQRASGT
ncbi:MAG: NAD(+) diphosphatase [Steroidobacteraceae bacterium]